MHENKVNLRIAITIDINTIIAIAISSIISFFVGYFLRKIQSFFSIRRHLNRLEQTYSDPVKYVKRSLEEPSYVFRRLPEKVVVEVVHIDGKPIKSSILSFLKKLSLSLRKQHYV